MYYQFDALLTLCRYKIVYIFPAYFPIHPLFSMIYEMKGVTGKGQSGMLYRITWNFLLTTPRSV